MTTALTRSRRIGANTIKLLLWLCLAAAMLFPVYWSLVTSIKPPSDLITDPPIFWPRQFAAVANYGQVMRELALGRYYFNSFYVAIVSTLAVLFTSSLGGYVFEKINLHGNRVKDILFLGIIATMMVPFPVRMIPVYLLFRDLHLLNKLAGLYVGALMSAYGIFLLRQFVKSIPNELLDAARIDGCKEFFIYGRIVLPLCKPALAALGIFHFMGEWDSFLWPLLIIDSMEYRTLPIGLARYRTMFGLMAWNKIMASCVMATVPVFIVFLLGQRQFIQGITLTGLKG